MKRRHTLNHLTRLTEKYLDFYKIFDFILILLVLFTFLDQISNSEDQ